MKILLLGKDGQVGRELQRSLAPLGDILACGRHEANLEDFDALRTLVRHEAPQWIINAAAYTAVDHAEVEATRARKINTEAVALLAEESQRLGARLVHYSTDHVFDGSKPDPYTEQDPSSPINIYGATKRDGEEAIRASACRHLIFRTSWVYAAHGNNFARTMLQLVKKRDEIKVVADQIGAPTCADLIADVTALCLYRITLDPECVTSVSGTYHLAAAGETSWHGYAQFVAEAAVRCGLKSRAAPHRILPIKTSEYPLHARRPLNSRLDTTRLRTTFGLVMPPWQQHVSRTVEALVMKGTT